MVKKINSINIDSSIKKVTNKGEISNNFSEFLAKSIEEVNALQKNKEKSIADMSTGQVKDLHQAALSINKAETSMKLMLEVRNKAINAYKEILRTQV